MIDSLITPETISAENTSWEDESGYHVGYDTNNDGQYDTVETYAGFDAYGNPTHYEISYDTDHNGMMDTVMGVDMNEYGQQVDTYESYDYDQDGRMDMTKLYVDNTGDGEFDQVTTTRLDTSDSDVVMTMDTQIDLSGNHQADQGINMQFIDQTGNGEPDIVHLELTDGQGNVLEQQDMTYEEFINMNQMNYSSACMGENLAAQFNPDAADPDAVAGTPAEDMEHWEYQGQTGRCAIYAQKFAIEAITGREIPIEELVAVAEENGWFVPGENEGTVSLNMDKLVEYYGVENEMSFNNDIESLEEALNDGHKVIVSVDSGQIWKGEENDIFSPETTADHAVEVIGIDRTDPENPMVVLNDSGTPNGCGELVPLEVFENAWSAGDSQMIECWAA
ncbi:MAG: C39 family peptidase [Bacteroidales bacterium]|nr:C39 family peptidase [Bacteroidales bacterium]MDD6731571.1 C39 family peptidase [Bacteroidales bacterium]MDY4558385.1 C39 family peptidase [Alloprevotella sp.]